MNKRKDFFETFERVEILLNEIERDDGSVQALVFNLPGQSNTSVESEDIILNNKLNSEILNELVLYLCSQNEFTIKKSSMYVGIGNGGNTISHYAINYPNAELESILLINPFAYIDSRVIQNLRIVEFVFAQ